jgi:hypothetical protein
MCLAELELEHTHLKDTTATNRTVDSVSAR